MFSSKQKRMSKKESSILDNSTAYNQPFQLSSGVDSLDYGSITMLQSSIGNSGVTQLLSEDRDSMSSTESYDKPIIQKKVVQGNFTEKGQEYREGIKEGEWGSYIEAHTIANSFSVRSAIYILNGGHLQQVSEIGSGTQSNYALLWVNGNHYQVVQVNGHNMQVNAGQWNHVHNPVGEGDCLYESMIFLTKPERASYIVGDNNTRERFIWLMRSIAYRDIDPQLANIAGNEDYGYDEAEGLGDEVFIVEFGKTISLLEKDYPPKEWKRIVGKKNKITLVRRDGTGKILGLVQVLKRYKVEKSVSDKVIDYMKGYSVYKDEDELEPEKSEEVTIAIKFYGDDKTTYDSSSFKLKAEGDSGYEMREREISGMLTHTQGKAGPMFAPYIDSGQTKYLVIGNNTHYHSSSRNGVTIAYTLSSTTYTIHAIMKHSKHPNLKRTATYEVIKSYNPQYPEGSKIGYKK